MSISNSRLSYTDCYEFLDKAIEDDKGVRVPLGEWAKANFFRMRCHQARSITKKDNREIYQPGDPQYGVSIYDVITIRLKEDEAGEWWVYAEKNLLEPGTVESLSELGE